MKQINRSNVTKLRVAWTYPTGDGARYIFNPVEIRGVDYLLAKNSSIVALDAAEEELGELLGGRLTPLEQVEMGGQPLEGEIVVHRGRAGYSHAKLSGCST